MIQRQQLIAVGHFNKPHGVAGELSASLDVELSTLDRLKCVVTDIDGIFVPFFIASARPKSASTALLTIDGIKSDSDAALLVNKTIFALKEDYDNLRPRQSSLPEGPDGDEEQLPIDYFIGFTVMDDDNDAVVGVVDDVDDTTENVLFLVRRDNGDIVRIPAVDELIVDIDLDNKVIDMALPDGLLSL